MQKRVAVQKNKKLLRRIFSLRDKHPDWKASKIHEALQKEFPGNVPSKRAIQDTLHPKDKPENREFEIDPDSLWSLAIQAKANDFPSYNEAIPAILELQRNQAITIRRAKWMTILYPVVKEVIKDDTDNSRESFLSILAVLSGIYVDVERISEKAGEEFDSRDFDSSLLNFSTVDAFRRWLMFFPGIDPDQRMKAGEYFFALELAAAYGRGNYVIINLSDYYAGINPENPDFDPDVLGQYWLFFSLVLSAVHRHAKEIHWDELSIKEKRDILVRKAHEIPGYLKRYLEAALNEDGKAMGAIFSEILKSWK